MQKLLILAALTAVSVGQPAAAQSTPAPPAPAEQTVIVRHRDLDLRTEAGTRTLDRRIWRAVVDVCGTASDFDIEGKNDVRHCRRETRAAASAEADKAIASASRNQLIRVSSIRN